MERKKEDYLNSKWRPMMGWQYMIVCAADFVVFPILYAIYNAIFYNGSLPSNVPSQWVPLTLQGAGLYHISMGAILGVTAWGRTQEKINGAAVPVPIGQPTVQSAPQIVTGYKGKPGPAPEPNPIL